MPSPFPKPRADALVGELDLSPDGLCIACLGIVALEVNHGDARSFAGAVLSVTPDLWHEGLAEKALAAVRAAAARGVKDAEAALADLRRAGSRSGVARAIVRRLATELAATTRIAMTVEERARSRLGLAPPELN